MDLSHFICRWSSCQCWRLHVSVCEQDWRVQPFSIENKCNMFVFVVHCEMGFTATHCLPTAQAFHSNIWKELTFKGSTSGMLQHLESQHEIIEWELTEALKNTFCRLSPSSVHSHIESRGALEFSTCLKAVTGGNVINVNEDQYQSEIAPGSINKQLITDIKKYQFYRLLCLPH